MALEIERKFLIPKLPADLASFPHNEIMQGYYFNQGEKLVRLRKKGNTYYQTEKSGMGLIREEDEETISPSIFEEERNNVEERYLEKTRYEIPYEGTIIELDIYTGKLEGLVVAEIEFSSEEEAKALNIPERFGRELTDVAEATNAYLAKYGMTEALQ
ncbi:MAG: adenylate cyclase [candidate division SR1 bacterium]|nr:adenylate cyclase [candidate division SR1 bacterium]